MKLKFAHIGLELDGAWWSVKSAIENHNLEFVAIAEPKQFLLDMARERRDPLGLALPIPCTTQYYQDYIQMLDQVKPDFVSIFTPLSQHLEVVRECAKRKVHCWIQKPAAMNGSEAREIVHISRDAGITCVVDDFQLVFPPIMELFRRVEAGEIGDVTKVISIHGFSGQIDHGCSKWYMEYFFDRARHGGGCMMDQTSYSISRALYILGRPQSVFALAPIIKDETQPGGPVEDDALVILEYPKAQAICAGSWAYPNYGVGDLQVYGRQGCLYAMDGTLYRRSAQTDMSMPRPDYQRIESPQSQIYTMPDYLLQGKPLMRFHTPDFMAMVNEVIDAGYESVKTKRAICIN